MKEIQVLMTRKAFTITDEMIETLEAGEDVLLKAPKPKKKIIDLSKVVGRDVDCEFTDIGLTDWYVFELKAITNGDFIYETVNGSYAVCRIRQDKWMYHCYQKHQPIPDGLAIQIIDNDNISLKFVLERNSHDVDWPEVTAYRVLGVAEGYRYEWENDDE